MTIQRTWLVGSTPECDVVVSKPTVSGRHCRLSRRPDGYVLEDLGSTNGTFVNGVRISSVVQVKPSDTIKLGDAVPLPWPEDPGDAPAATSGTTRVIRIGSDRDNDVVLDDPVVSKHHAR